MKIQHYSLYNKSFCALSLGLILSLTSCQSSQKPAATEPKSVNSGVTGPISQRMRVMADHFVALMAYVGDSSRFNADQNSKEIQEKLKDLELISKNLKADLPQISEDPSLKILSAQFESQIRDSSQSFALGRKEYARYSLQNSLNTCVQCHTRTQAGPAFNDEIVQNRLKSLNPMEKAEILTATRNFEPALEEFKELLASDKIDNTLLREKAARHALLITVKFLQDPKASLEIAQNVIDSKGSSKILKQNARIWKNSIQDWKKEKVTPSAYADQLALVKKWTTKAFQLNQKFKEQAGDIYALRASALVHQLLERTIASEAKAELLLLAGENYEVLGDLQFADLNEEFYEACIKEYPHSKVALKCYAKLEQNIYEGYTGNSGTFIPEEVEDHLEKLNDLASPAKKTDTERK